MTSFRPLVAIAALLTAHAAFAAEPATGPAASLYARLGGEPVVTRVVEQTVRTIAADPHANQSLEGVNLAKLDAKIVVQICALAGGGCDYTGEDMKTAHDGMNIGQREFYALVEALRTALDENGVGEREKNELLKLLAPMKRDVVSR
jgi:hemoglobin